MLLKKFLLFIFLYLLLSIIPLIKAIVKRDRFFNDRSPKPFYLLSLPKHFQQFARENKNH